jgi:hypothetical protein
MDRSELHRVGVWRMLKARQSIETGLFVALNLLLPCTLCDSEHALSPLLRLPMLHDDIASSLL